MSIVPLCIFKPSAKHTISVCTVPMVNPKTLPTLSEGSPLSCDADETRSVTSRVAKGSNKPFPLWWKKQPTSAQHMWELIQDCWKSWLRKCQECAKLSSRQRVATLKTLKYILICLTLFWLLHDSICVIS